MFLKYKQKTKTLFFHKECEAFESQESVNIILSPEFYWVKKVSLPVKYLRDVKPLLPSLFDGSIPEGIYSYTAYKEGDDYYIFAYQDKLILDALHSKNIKTSQVKNIYFAQSEMKSFDQALYINDSIAMYKEEELFVIVPSLWVEDTLEMDMESLNLTKNTVVLKQFGHLVDNKSIYMLMGVFTFLLLIVGGEFYITSQKLLDKEQQREKLFEEHGLKPTMMQNRAMLSELDRLHENQVQVRQILGSFLGLRLSKDEKISSVSLKNKKLVVEFKDIKKDREANIRKALKVKQVLFKSTYKSNVLKIEVKI